MERFVEWFVATTSVMVGLSHILRAQDWANTFRSLHRLGPSGAFLNGGLSLAMGSLIVAGVGASTWLQLVLAVFGWLLITKGAISLVVPSVALRSMERGSKSPRGFIIAGFLLLLLGLWTVGCLWMESRTLR